VKVIVMALPDRQGDDGGSILARVLQDFTTSNGRLREPDTSRALQATMKQMKEHHNVFPNDRYGTPLGEIP
jgi:hypothetical protein